MRHIFTNFIFSYFIFSASKEFVCFMNWKFEIFSILFVYHYWELSVFSPCFLNICSKYSWISDTEYYPSGNLNSSVHVEADTKNARYKENIVCMISYSKFSDILLAFTCASAIGNLWRVCLGVIIFLVLIHVLLHI